jgi:hypothetical protein
MTLIRSAPMRPVRPSTARGGIRGVLECPAGVDGVAIYSEVSSAVPQPRDHSPARPYRGYGRGDRGGLLPTVRAAPGRVQGAGWSAMRDQSRPKRPGARLRRVFAADGGGSPVPAIRRASPPGSRLAWEADTLPAELLPPAERESYSRSSVWGGNGANCSARTFCSRGRGRGSSRVRSGRSKP